MEKVINIGIPHVGEQIFEHIDNDRLIEFFIVSPSWKALAGEVLLKRLIGPKKTHGTKKRKRPFKITQSQKRKIQVVDVIVNYSDYSKLNILDKKGQTAFVWACENGHIDIVQLLLNHSDDKIQLNKSCRISNVLKRSAFMIACAEEQVGVVQVILEHPKQRNIDFNAKDTIGRTAFMIACFHGSLRLVQLFMEHLHENIDLNAQDDYGSTAFMFACANGHRDIVKLLLDQPHGRIEYNTTDHAGKTAFARACYNQHFEIIQSLLQYNAKVRNIITESDINQMTPFVRDLKIQCEKNEIK